ncbi:MAG: hypothetical protein R3C05_07925 [Pirellulaceae bacterium]
MGDQFCGDLSLVDESLIVNTINDGVANVVVYLQRAKTDDPLPTPHADIASSTEKFELSSVNCNFTPRILAMKVGDRLSIINTDDIGCNANFAFFNNPNRALQLPPKSHAVITPTESEPAPIPVTSLIYPWMHARLLILEHRFCGISDANGVLTIPDLPVDVSIIFRVYHERGDFRGLRISEGEVNRRSLFQCELHAGVNDFGTVVDAKLFANDNRLIPCVVWTDAFASNEANHLISDHATHVSMVNTFDDILRKCFSGDLATWSV